MPIDAIEKLKEHTPMNVTYAFHTDKTDALETLMSDARKHGPHSNASARRVLKACRVLGLSDDEIRRTFVWLEYAHYLTGETYRKTIKRIWP